MSDTARQMLKQNKISVTDARISLLDLFIRHKKPLSYAFIRKQRAKGITRFTLHRTLKLFLGKKLIHGTLDDNGVRTYLIRCDEENNQIARLECKECGVIYNIANFSIEKTAVLKKYKVENIDILITGTCEYCNTKKHDSVQAGKNLAALILATTIQILYAL